MFLPSEKCLEMIKAQEGLVLHPYKDTAGIPTIGIGTTRYPTGVSVKMSDPAITIEQANGYLLHDLQDSAATVNHLTEGVIINQEQFDALCDFAYNCGGPALASSTLIKRIKANPNDPNIGDAFLMWDKIHVDGKLEVSDTLFKRRKAEIALYFS